MSEQDPSLDPGQEQRLRALLADLGSGAGSEDDQLPAEVAARLEATLAGLVAEREAESRVVPLRQRWMPRVAAAAAAVIVLGLGALTAVNLGHLGGHDSTTSGEAGAGSSRTEQGPKAELAPGPVLHSATFAHDVRVLLLHAPALRAPARVRGELDGSSATRAPASRPGTCPGPSTTDGSSTTVVELDAEPAALVVHPGRKGARLVEAWSCDGTRRLASTTTAP